MGQHSAIAVAIFGAALMMSHHVGAKSVRDALFLSHFDITSLPLMVMAASTLSLLLALGASGAMRRFTPARTITAAFACSAALYGLIGLMAESSPRLSAVLLFLLVAGTGSLLTSGFWSLLSECFDPNTVRKSVGRVAAGGTAGVVLGGILAERVGALGSVRAMLPLLAMLHAMCAVAAFRLARSVPSQPGSRAATPAEDHGLPLLSIVREAPYLKPLAMLVLSGTIAAGLIDYVFKSQSVAAFGSGGSLLRFFAVFNAGIGLLTFLLQATASRAALTKLGIGKTLLTLPSTAALGGFAAMILPGLPACAFARGAESAFRSSLFRSGYELFYAPVPLSEKRAAKPLIDVGFDRLGDALAGGAVRAILFGLPALANQAILTLAVLLGIAGVWIAMRLEEAYIDVLESNLMKRADELNLGADSHSILSSMTMARLSLSGEEREDYTLLEVPPDTAAMGASGRLGLALRNMTSGDLWRARHVLTRDAELDPLLVPAAINLLASDVLYSDAVRVLRKTAAANVGQFIDRLLRPDEVLSVRRRIPRVLACCPVQRAADGMLLGLACEDFDVRFRCGRALAAIAQQNSGIVFPPGPVYAAVKREAAQGQAAWMQSRLCDGPADQDDPGLATESLRGQSDCCLEHVFTLLSLVLPREPLRVAYHGLYTDDPHLRGTALEYLESVLPPDIQLALWPYLNDHRLQSRRGAPPRSAADELLKSQHAIMVNLEARRQGGRNS